jgi:predicted ArsR family transcriptional regulator
MDSVREYGDVGNDGAANAVEAVSALDDPVRRNVYDLVAASTEPLTRDVAAARLGIPRSTATFHLERLVSVGLLRAGFAKFTGRTGPGSGRPAKLYAVTEDEVAISVPPRHYDLAARVLARAVELAAMSGAPVADALEEAASTAGGELAAGSSSLWEVLRRNDFRPRVMASGVVVLDNCPFHRLVQEHPQTVCTLNLHLIRGAARASGDGDVEVTLDPAPGRCCVAVSWIPEQPGATARTAPLAPRPSP